VKTIDDTHNEDPELVTLAAVMVELRKLLGNSLMTVGDIKDAVNERETASDNYPCYGAPRYRHPELRQVLIDAAGTRGEVDSRRLGGFFKRYKGRIVGGMKLVSDQDRKRKQQTWGVRVDG
jgi:hypothetical protein